ncbi:MAG: transposase [Gammaproteobacteria bacterium]|nr:transposase [Gammaproteobacteria bacterium]
MDDPLKPKDHAEAVALFRAQVLGPVLCRELRDHGELACALRELAKEPVRPPGADVSRTYAPSTLERWYYAYQQHGAAGLRPQHLARGQAQALTSEQRELLRAIRRERPTVSAALILRTLVLEGRLPESAISAATLRRFYRAEGLDRQSLAAQDRQPRRRWQADAPGVLWHADVCHGPALRIAGRSVPLRIHAILDDYSRYVIAIQACTTERESEMLALMVKALRAEGAPNVLYLDNGATYSGHALATACTRMGIALVHAKPYDAPARGKMERLWRTMREQCLDHCAGLASLHDVQARLLAWLDAHYHATAHAGLLGKCPALVYEQCETKPVPESMLAEALTVRGTRRMRRDGTVSIAGTDFELDHSYLAGRNVTVARSLLDPASAPWVEHEEQRLALRPVDPVANGQRPKPHRPRTGIDAVPFDPATALLDRVTRRSRPQGTP